MKRNYKLSFIHLYITHKRFMHTQEETRSQEINNSPVLNPPPKKSNAPIDQEIVVDPSGKQLDEVPTLNKIKDEIGKRNAAEKERLAQELEALKLRQKINRQRFANIEGNETSEPEKPLDALYQTPDISKAALLTNTVLKGFVTNIKEVGDKFNIQITESLELAKQWGAHIALLDQYIKSLCSWKRTLTYTFCLITILSFLYRMGALRAIPQFLNNVISIMF